MDDILALFDPDPVEAERRIAVLVHSLERYFEWSRCAGAKDLAQTTITRGIEKLRGGAPMTAHKPEAYFVGIAQFVRMEQRRVKVDHQWSGEEYPMAERSFLGFNTSDAGMLVNRALSKLRPEDQQLFKSYHLDGLRGPVDGMSALALRLRIMRIRRKLLSYLDGDPKQKTKGET